MEVSINQDIKALEFDQSENDAEFIYAQMTALEDYIVRSIVKTGTTVQSVSIPDLERLDLPVPIRSEQTRIGEFFRTLDTLIAANQRKVDLLANAKRCYYKLLFPEVGQLQPYLRSPGFTEDWKEYAFASVFEPIRSNTLAWADMNFEHGEVMCIHYGDVLTKFGAVTNCETETIPFISHATIGQYANQLLRDGDIVLADAAEDETVGKATEISDSRLKPVVSGLHTIACHPRWAFEPFYLGLYLNSPSFHSQLLPLMQGTKVLSISRNAIAATKILYPSSRREQGFVASLFQNLDKMTAACMKTVEDLQYLKRAYLQKMFI